MTMALAPGPISAQGSPNTCPPGLPISHHVPLGEVPSDGPTGSKMTHLGSFPQNRGPWRSQHPPQRPPRTPTSQDTFRAKPWSPLHLQGGETVCGVTKPGCVCPAPGGQLRNSCLQQSEGLFAGCKEVEPVTHALRPELPSGFRARVFKDGVGGADA